MHHKNIEILLVEDDEVDVMNVKRAFRKAKIDYPLHVASDGIEALELLRGPLSAVQKRLPRIVLLDINMPRMNGLEFLKEVRSDSVLKNLSVIILTTSNQDSDLKTAYQHNVAGYIVKPLSATDFFEVINTLKRYWDICEF